MVASEQAVNCALDTSNWVRWMAQDVEEEVHGLLVGTGGDAVALNADIEVKEDALLGWCCQLPAKFAV